MGLADPSELKYKPTGIFLMNEIRFFRMHPDNRPVSFIGDSGPSLTVPLIRPNHPTVNDIRNETDLGKNEYSDIAS